MSGFHKSTYLVTNSTNSTNLTNSTNSTKPVYILKNNDDPGDTDSVEINS